MYNVEYHKLYTSAVCRDKLDIGDGLLAYITCNTDSTHSVGAPA